MQACRVAIILTLSVAVVADCGAQSPPPLLARPRAVYYPHGPGSSPIRVTDLYQAVMENDEREVLLKHDAKVALRDSWGKSPLDYAKEVKDAAIIKQIEVARAGNH